MKGTTARGRTVAEDNQLAKWLFTSEKNRAENVMIVDMIRNDIGRVSETGSVYVPQLFNIERYPTILQMTSTVTGTSQAGIADIMAALFPCASITGAPKVSTMQIISELEPEPRGVYTGCIGFFAPGRRAQFNVAIRTVVVDKKQETAEYGVGGGIVWGSEMESEYEEWQTKARILTERRPDFELLESMLWLPDDGFFLLDRHLKRLSESARYFGFHCDLHQVREKLTRFMDPGVDQPQKVRLILHKNGSIEVERSSVGKITPTIITLATEPIDSNDVFFYHKTTHRQMYELMQIGLTDIDDVLLWNKEEELTETTTANIVLNINGDLITPPVSSGLLAGTFRQELLKRGQIQEGVVKIHDLAEVEEIFLINSVRKWRKGLLVGR
jgi:para-aminobenzoate synthetase/4-amino-4-deoxychorismate lyase